MMSSAMPSTIAMLNAPAFFGEPSPDTYLSSLPVVSPSSSMTCMPLHKQPPSKQGMMPMPVGLGRQPSLAALPKKPLRPLTAYHIFFQIEREHVIQTLDGAIADPSILEGKAKLADVPRRYKDTLLAPDWYAGPGKRKKRKHRKQHGKIGFLELSRVISQRWASLEAEAPDVKEFVRAIAQRELEGYYREMKEYKALSKEMGLPEKRAEAPKKKSKKRAGASITQTMPDVVPSSTYHPIMPLLKNDIDHFLRCLDDNTQQPSLLPPCLPTNEAPLARPSCARQVSNDDICRHASYRRQDNALSLSTFDPMMAVPSFVDHERPSPAKKPRQVSLSCGNGSPTGVDMCPSPSSSFEVDLCDQEIMDLWNTQG